MKLKWDGFGMSKEARVVIMLVIAVLLVIMLFLKNRNAVLPLPIAWAYFRIYQQLNAAKGLKGQ